eukprot:Gb_29092 [translate_table: standard]
MTDPGEGFRYCISFVWQKFCKLSPTVPSVHKLGIFPERVRASRQEGCIGNPIGLLLPLFLSILLTILGEDSRMEGTKSFVTKLFHALEDGSIPTSFEELEGIKLSDGATTVVSGEPTALRSSSPQSERLPSATIRAFNELEEKEVSDDDDDDRNHKHRRRVTRSQSFDRDGQDEDERRPNRKRGRSSDNCQPLQESEPQFSERRREYTPSHTHREGSLKYDRRHHGSTPSPRLSADGGQRATRGSQTYRNEAAARFDVQNSFVRAPLGRGRGRSTSAWAPHDSRFTPVETIDFASAMPPQGSTSTNLYPGRTIPNSGNSANSPWSPFGLIPGMPNGGLEQLHPLHAGLQGGRGNPLNAAMGISMGIPRPRCRDFEERGFCLRGDMCPMEHGINRIVVEDVQSLSQFNLPVSLPSGHLLGMKTGPVGGPSAAVVSSLALASKVPFNKSNKFGANEDTVHLNGLPTASPGNEPDLYDPDQPLWNKDHPDAAGGLMRLSSPRKGEGEHLWDDDTSDKHSCRLSDGESERPGRSIGTVGGSQNAVPSVWGRIGPLDRAGNKSEGLNRMGDISNEAPQRGNQLRNEVYDEQQSYSHESARHGDQDNEMDVYEDIGSKGVNTHFQQGKVEASDTPGRRLDSGSHLSSGLVTRGNLARGSRGKGTERALCTLFVNCIPSQSNRRELLLSHFQKFGKVLDIHIPKNTEKAFVQFCRREDAESALTSPDAVMGNRFIRLSWANRDSVLPAGDSSATAAPPGKIPIVGPVTLPGQQVLAEKGKEKNCDVPALPVVSTFGSLTADSASLKPVRANDGPAPSVSAVQKKLELLEAFRRKQEVLAQKRDHFRRQLDKLEKQGTVSRVDVSDIDQVVQRQKEAVAADCTSISSKSCHTNIQPCAVPDGSTGNDQLVTRSNSGDFPNQITGSNLLSPALISQPSPKSLKLHFSRITRPVAAPMFIPNRFKLDNRPTAFRVLPPLPAGLMDIATLKEHFAVFGDLSTVELDDVEGHFDGAARAQEKSSVRVAYITRRAAERAFTHGRFWQGQNLQFAWLMPSNNTVNHVAVENVPSQNSKGSSNGVRAAEKETPHGAAGDENEISSRASQVEKEISSGEEVRENGGRNTSNITAENSMEGCGNPATELIEGGSEFNSTQCSTPQFEANVVATKLDGSRSSVDTLAQIEFSTCKTIL